MDPCETPQKTGTDGEENDPILTVTVQPFKKEANHCKAL